MKTITEFLGVQIKNAAKTIEELTAAGKTAEELPAALGEAVKMEGDKLKFLMNAVEVSKQGSKKGIDNLKRVVVIQLGENEKAPYGAIKKDEQCYVIEMIPQAYSAARAQAEANRDRDDRRGGGKGRGDKKGGKGGRGGRDGGRDGGRGRRDENRAAGKEGRPQGGEGQPFQAGERPQGEAGGEGQRRRRPRRAPAGPRADQPQTPPKPPGWVVKPKGAPADAPAQNAAPASTEGGASPAAENNQS